MLRLLNFRL